MGVPLIGLEEVGVTVLGPALSPAIAGMAAVVPLVSPYVAALPAIAELLIVDSDWLSAMLLFLLHLLPSFFVDAAIYSEIEG